MTHLDVMAQILHEVSGDSIHHWRAVLREGLAANGSFTFKDIDLRQTVSQEEADEILTRLRAPAARQVVLTWLLTGTTPELHFPQSQPSKGL